MMIVLSFNSNILTNSINDFYKHQITEQEQMVFEDFSNFYLYNDCENITSILNNECLYFNVNYNSTIDCWESYRLNLRELGNVSDCELRLTQTINCNNSQYFAYFGISILTDYNYDLEQYTNESFHLAGMGIGKEFFHQTLNYYRLNADFYFLSTDNDKVVILNKKEEITFSLSKKGKEVFVNFLDANNKSLFNTKASFGIHYANIKEIQIGFLASSYSQFIINVTNFRANVSFEYRDMSKLIRKDEILTVLKAIFIVLSSILAIIALIISMLFMRKMIRKRRKNKDREIQEELQKEFTKWNLKNESEKVVILEGLVYEGEIPKDAKCAVCKLSIKKNKDILHCPNCKTLFHKDHLIDWLEQKNNCPICKKPLLK